VAVPSQTIFALSSGGPPAAIAIIRISGAGAHAAGWALAGDLPPARQAAVRELRHPASGELLDEALVLRFDGPASSTGEDLVEFHCHGGRAVVEAVLEAIALRDGPRLALPGEFTRRAFENGRIDLTEAEGLADLIEAETESQRRAALLMAEGGLRKQIEDWQQRLLELSARAEAAIDYVDDQSVDGDPALAAGCAALASELCEWLGRPRAEPLREGVRVVMAGPPNVGKSSLLNALVGQERAIVTASPGTTRDHIEVSLAFSGLPLLLTDTAGLRATGELVEQIGVERSRRLIDLADILVWMGEPDESPDHPRLIRIHARSDLPGRGQAPAGSLAVSSRTSQGLPELAGLLVEEARRLLPADGRLALNRRQAECIAQAHAALQHTENVGDLAVFAEDLRSARTAFDRLTGRAGVEYLLDNLFGRFCLGK
jgi:tRNA modification GTPase